MRLNHLMVDQDWAGVVDSMNTDGLDKWSWMMDDWCGMQNRCGMYDWNAVSTKKNIIMRLCFIKLFVEKILLLNERSRVNSVKNWCVMNDWCVMNHWCMHDGYAMVEISMRERFWHPTDTLTLWLLVRRDERHGSTDMRSRLVRRGGSRERHGRWSAGRCIQR